MNPALQQFISIALPIMITFVATIWVAQWGQNKRFDDLNRRFDEVLARLTRMEQKLDGMDARVIRLEEQSPLLRR